MSPAPPPSRTYSLFGEDSEESLDSAVYYSAFSNNPTALVIIDAQTKVITNWNSYATELFGYSAAEAIGETLDLIIPGFMMALAEHDTYIDNWVAKGGVARSFDIGRNAQARTRLGDTPYVRIKVFPVFLENELVAIGAAIVDITSERASVNALEKTNVDLEHTRSQLKRVNEQLVKENANLIELKATAERERAEAQFRVRQLRDRKDVIFWMLSLLVCLLVIPQLIGVFSRVSEGVLQTNRDILLILAGSLGGALTAFFQSRDAQSERVIESSSSFVQRRGEPTNAEDNVPFIAEQSVQKEPTQAFRTVPPRNPQPKDVVPRQRDRSSGGGGEM